MKKVIERSHNQHQKQSNDQSQLSLNNTIFKDSK